MNKAAIHANRKEDWRTPLRIFRPLHAQYKFTIDCAADSTNHLLDDWIGPDHPIAYRRDFLSLQPLHFALHTAWINPPYGDYLEPFTEHIVYLARLEVPICALLPGSIDTNWFWDNVHSEANVYGRRGRIQFEPVCESGNPGPSILALYNISEAPWGWIPLSLRTKPCLLPRPLLISP